jgi:hypothetical protein
MMNIFQHKSQIPVLNPPICRFLFKSTDAALKDFEKTDRL